MVAKKAANKKRDDDPKDDTSQTPQTPAVMTADEQILASIELLKRSRASQVITDVVPRPIADANPPDVGRIWYDPAFGSRLVRVTGPETDPENPNLSFRTPSSSVQRGWNADGTRCLVQDPYGRWFVFDVDPSSLRVERRALVGLKFDPTLLATVNRDAGFHDRHPDVVYAGVGNRVIKSINVANGAEDVVVDLDSLGLDLLPDSYSGAIYVNNNLLLVACGGQVNDWNHWLVLVDLATFKTRTLDTKSIRQFPAFPEGFTVHGAVLDVSGRFVLIQPPSGTGNVLFVWDLSTDGIVEVSTGVSGHFATGRSAWVNQDCAPGSTWDAHQWIYRTMEEPNLVTNLIDPVLRPALTYSADHSSWNNMRTLSDPFLSVTYRYAVDPCPWRPWDDEVLMVESLTGVVKRHCHHRSRVVPDEGQSWNFDDTPRGNLAPNGRFAMFTSNWNRMLGTDPVDGRPRRDVFVVELR